MKPYKPARNLYQTKDFRWEEAADKGELDRCDFWRKDVRIPMTHLECGAVSTHLSRSDWRSRFRKWEMGPVIGILLRLDISEDG